MAASKKRLSWIRKTILWTFFLSVFFNGVSQALLERMGLVGSLGVLLLIIVTGVAFDIVGVAATAANLPPLNARAAKRVAGAKQALDLARNSDRVASFCNDVIGDIAGIISGSAAAAIVFNLPVNYSGQRYIIIGVMAVVASFTVGGKGLGKGLAMEHSTDILMVAGKIIGFAQRLWPFSAERGSGKRGL